jgi:hypothetical protein
MPFIRDPFRYYQPENFECFEDTVGVAERSSSELLRQDIHEVVQHTLGQLCWSFWQSPEEFPADEMRNYIAQVLAEMRV